MLITCPPNAARNRPCRPSFMNPAEHDQVRPGSGAGRGEGPVPVRAVRVVRDPVHERGHPGPHRAVQGGHPGPVRADRHHLRAVTRVGARIQQGLQVRDPRRRRQDDQASPHAAHPTRRPADQDGRSVTEPRAYSRGWLAAYEAGGRIDRLRRRAPLTPVRARDPGASHRWPPAFPRRRPPSGLRRSRGRARPGGCHLGPPADAWRSAGLLPVRAQPVRPAGRQQLPARRCTSWASPWWPGRWPSGWPAIITASKIGPLTRRGKHGRAPRRLGHRHRHRQHRGAERRHPAARLRVVSASRRASFSRCL